MVPSSDPSESFEPGQWPDSQKRDLLPTLEQSAKDPAEWIQRRQQSRVLLGPIEPMRNPSGVEAAVEAGDKRKGGKCGSPDRGTNISHHRNEEERTGTKE